MGKKKKYIMNNYFKYAILVFSIFFLIMLVLFLVTRPALFGCFVLGDDASSIGSAIGGIGAVIVGIANVIMLYLTFNEQRKANKKQQIQIEEEKKERIAEKEYSNFLEFQNQLERIKQSWFFKELNINKTIFVGIDAINKYVSLCKYNNTEEMLNKETINADILFNYQEFYAHLCEIKKRMKNDYQKRLLSQSKSFYEHFMKNTIAEIIAFETKDKRKWVKINNLIENIFKLI